MQIPLYQQVNEVPWPEHLLNLLHHFLHHLFHVNNLASALILVLSPADLFSLYFPGLSVPGHA